MDSALGRDTEQLVTLFNRVIADSELYNHDRFPDADAGIRALLTRGTTGGNLMRANRRLLESHELFGRWLKRSFQRYEASDFEKFSEALRLWKADRPRHAVIELTAGRDYNGNLHFRLHANQSLQIQARDVTRPALRLINQLPNDDDDMTVRCESGSRLIIDGLTIGNYGIEINGCEAGACDVEIAIRHCTLVPRGEAAGGNQRQCLVLRNVSGRIRIEHSILGSIVIENSGSPAHLTICDSIIDAGKRTTQALDGGLKPNCDVSPANVVLDIRRSTVFGQVAVNKIALAEDTIFAGKALAVSTDGCVRFCYLFAIEALNVPKFQCAHGDALKFRTAEHHFKHSDYCRLKDDSPLASAGTQESEMGVFHNLFSAQRFNNLKTRVEEYLPIGGLNSILQKIHSAGKTCRPTVVQSRGSHLFVSEFSRGELNPQERAAVMSGKHQSERAAHSLVDRFRTAGSAPPGRSTRRWVRVPSSVSADSSNSPSTHSSHARRGQ